MLTILNAESITLNNENNEELQTEIINDTEHESKVDCLILEDENSIICKFETQRKTNDEQIIIQWIDPQGDVSRSRDMLVPAGHGSIYDYRYLNGRLLGTWAFKVISNDIVYKTEFELK
jgi:hypothetical protein